MKEKFTSYRAKRIISRYKSYPDFSLNASNSEKKVVIKNTLNEANKQQRATAKA